MFEVFFATRLWGGDEDYSSPTRSRRPLAYTAYLNESELFATYVDGRLYDRATSRHKLIAPSAPA